MSDFRISGASPNARTETDIRLNYGDPSKIVAAANDSGTGAEAMFFSIDGGSTWGNSILPLAPGDAFQSDPAVDWTSDGNAHALCIGVDSTQTITQTRAYQSPDNGNTWNFEATPSGVQTGTDREIIWVDHSPTSPFKDQVYATWHNGTPVFFARRTAGAGGTWQAAIQISGAETTVQGIGGDIKTNSFGDVFVFWPDADGSRNLVVTKSTDGGQTFPAGPVIIAKTFATTRRLSVPADSSRAARVYISAGAYRTATKDLVYAVWSDLSGAAGCNTGGGPGNNAASTCKTRIWFSRSTLGGVAGSWSAPVMLNNQASLNDQFHSKLCVDESNGNLIVTYRDTVNDPNRLQTEVFMQTSTDDGQTWSAAAQVSSAASDETTAGFNPNQYGDYDGLSGFFGSFFPSWTDRRTGGPEEIWSANVSIIQKQCFFILDRSTFGQDEVKAMLAAGQPTVDAAFYVVVDGFSAADLGITAADLVGAPSHNPTLTSSPAVAGMTVGQPAGQPTKLLAEDPALPPTPQRFTWVYAINFANANGFTQPTLNVTLNASIATVSGSAVIQLVQQENPYETDGATSWLSTDLRVFFVKQGQSKFNQPLNGGTPTDAINFITGVLTNLNPGGNSGGQTFENDLDPNGTDVALNQFDTGGNAIFNFAIAKVRYRALSQDANATRVFFRLCPALTVSTAFDPNTTYRTFSDGVQFGHKIPRLGRQNNNILTIPFFAQARMTPGASMDTQFDTTNVMTMPHDASGAEVVRYFGCWLDINQPGTPEFPLNPTDEGPYSGGLSILELVRNQHQCLLAEISYDLETIPTGATPSTSDKLAQRNLTLVPSANPGDVASRRIPSAFELKPTRAVRGLTADELMIDWGNVPSSSFARIFLPTVSADEILELLAKRYGPVLFKRIDGHTLECRVQGITYVPIPPGSTVNHTGLLTVDLPAGVKEGQRFDLLVRQVTPIGKTFVDDPRAINAAASVRLNARRVIGSFQIGIPVSVKEVMLAPEEQLLSILRWILLSVPPQDRWYPVFNRYVTQIAERVRGLGGDPNKIVPSPTGEVEPTPIFHPCPRPERRAANTGKIAGLIFDQFGDFEGFVLETEERDHKFFSREKDMEELAERAWSERLRVTVYAERDEPHRPLTVTVHRPPAHFKLRRE